ncbi:efflux RND transporter periplasmic adaptor subunit [Desulfobacterales bacterium HSG16]|nr:efflux RND transporter periplasmic adaptor subunit [Desulfobacterales bacterium HSG16]
MKKLKISILFFSMILTAFFSHAEDKTPVSEKTAKAEMKKIIEWYEAVGTVRPRTESSIEAQVTAQVMNVKVRPGTKVTKGMVLLTLDNRKFLSKLDQARQGLKTAIAGRKQANQGVIGAKAAFEQSESNFKRTKKYFKSRAATSRDLEQAESGYLQAKAGVAKAREALAGTKAAIRQAEEVIKEAEIALGYTKIKSPEEGEVLRRMVEPGDLALPGKPLIVLRTKGSLRLEAYVREGLIGKVKPHTTLSAVISTLDLKTDAVVEEIVPYADPMTRTFLVKASLPDIDGLFPGMFGKLLIPVQEHDVVMIPENSVSRVGQLELIQVREKNMWKTRFIKTGRIMDGMVEVLSGMSGNETIGINLKE